jgi:hypothetical protein
MVLLVIVLSSSAARGESSVTARGEKNHQQLKVDPPDCVAHLQHIYQMIKHFEHHSGNVAFPTLENLAWMTRDKSVFLCPEVPPMNRETKSFQTSYIMLNNPREHGLATVSPRDIAIVTERAAQHNGHRLVLFYDGTVSGLNRQEFEALEAHKFIRQQGVPDDAVR